MQAEILIILFTAAGSEHRIGRPLEVFSLIQHHIAVEGLAVMFHLIGRVGIGPPVGIKIDICTSRHLAGIGVWATAVGKPAEERIAGPHRVGGPLVGNIRSIQCREHGNIAAAIGVEVNITAVARIVPRYLDCAADRFRRERQLVIFPCDGNIAAVAGADHFRKSHDVAVRFVGEPRIAQRDIEAAFRVIIIVLRGSLSGLHIHVLHAEQLRRQLERLGDIKRLIGQLIVRSIVKVIDVVLRACAPQRPLRLVERRLIGQLVA